MTAPIDWGDDQPTAPARHTADTITSDALDQLYARIVTVEHVAAGNRRHVQLIVPDLAAALARAEQAEAERDKACTAFNAKVMCLQDVEAEVARLSAILRLLPAPGPNLRGQIIEAICTWADHTSADAGAAADAVLAVIARCGLLAAPALAEPKEPRT